MCRIETKILNEACTPVVFFSSNYLCHKLSRWTRLLPEANISFKDTAPLSSCRCLVSLCIAHLLLRWRTVYSWPTSGRSGAPAASGTWTIVSTCMKLACISLILQFYVFVTSFISYHFFWQLTCKKYNCKK